MYSQFVFVQGEQNILKVFDIDQDVICYSQNINNEIMECDAWRNRMRVAGFHKITCKIDADSNGRQMIACNPKWVYTHNNKQRKITATYQVKSHYIIATINYPPISYGELFCFLLTFVIFIGMIISCLSSSSSSSSSSGPSFIDGLLLASIINSSTDMLFDTDNSIMGGGIDYSIKDD